MRFLHYFITTYISHFNILPHDGAFSGALMQLSLVAAPCCCSLLETACSERGLRGLWVCHEPCKEGRKWQKHCNKWVQNWTLTRICWAGMIFNETPVFYLLIQIWTSLRRVLRGHCLACWITKQTGSCALIFMTHWVTCCHRLLWKSSLIGLNYARMSLQQQKVTPNEKNITNYHCPERNQDRILLTEFSFFYVLKNMASILCQMWEELSHLRWKKMKTPRKKTRWTTTSCLQV